MATNQLNDSDGEDKNLSDAIKAVGIDKVGAIENVGGFDGDGGGATEGPMHINQVPYQVLFNASVSTLSK
jgi:hypothetical protein